MEPNNILLIPDKYHWILGTIAKEIVKYNPDFSFAYSTRNQVINAPERVIELSRAVSLIHWILDLEFYRTLNPKFATFPKTLASVHHVLDWEKAQKCKDATLIHTVSYEWKEYLVDRGVDAKRIHVIPNGIDIRIFNPYISQQSARQSFGIPDASFVIGFFGSAMPLSRVRKGVDCFIQSMLELQSQIPEMLLFISGQNWQQDVEFLRSKALRVIYPSFLPPSRMPAAYRSLDVFVVTSTVEGGPVTAFEAMASGVPLVSTNVGMVRDAVIHEKHALILPTNKPDQIADAILLLYGNSELNQRLSNNAVKLVQDSFQWSQVAPKYGELYRFLLDQPQKSQKPLFSRKDHFIEQRKNMLVKDQAELLYSYWSQPHRKVVIDLFINIEMGFPEKVCVLLEFLRLIVYSARIRFVSWLRESVKAIRGVLGGE